MILQSDFELHYSDQGKHSISRYSKYQYDVVARITRQFRPAIETVTLELPGGQVDEGQSPEETELLPEMLNWCTCFTMGRNLQVKLANVDRLRLL